MGFKSGIRTRQRILGSYELDPGVKSSTAEMVYCAGYVFL